MASANKIRRRMTISDSNAELVGQVKQTIDELSEIWDEVDMNQETREKRTEAAYELFYSTMKEIVQNEREMIKGVFEDIEKNLAEVTSTRRELGLQPFPVDQYKSKSIALLRALDKDKSSLVERKTLAMARQLEEFNELVKICRYLGEQIPEIDSIQDRILPKSDVDEIVKKRVLSNKELQRRKVKTVDLQKKVIKRSTIVKCVSLCVEENQLLTIDLNDPNMVFSKCLVQRFDDLLEKFESEYEKWRENVTFQYLECYTKLASLAEKCYAFQLLDSYPQTIDLDIQNESLLEQLQYDLQTLDKRYNTGKDLFDKFAAWNTSFKKQDEIEAELATDKARKNRGGCLTKLLAEQKKEHVNAERLLHELQSACEDSADLEVTINNLNPYDFALHLIQEREQQKENEKLVKKHERTKQLQMEVRFGTSAIGSPAAKSTIGHSTRNTPKPLYSSHTPGRSARRASKTPLKSLRRSRTPGKLLRTPGKSVQTPNKTPSKKMFKLF